MPIFPGSEYTRESIFMCSSHDSRYLRLMAYIGITSLVIAVLLFGAGLAGLWPIFEIVYFGQTGLRGVASLAVAGCLLAAIGFWED